MKNAIKPLLITALLSTSSTYAYYDDFFDRDFRQIFNDFGRYLNTDEPISFSHRFNDSRQTWQYFDQKANAYVIQINLGDMDENDIKVNLENHRLHISSKVQKESKTDDKQGQYRYQSRAFSQTFLLPSDADEAEISADFDQSVLKITIPRKTISTPKAREIKVH